jgi:hypothetical protein
MTSTRNKLFLSLMMTCFIAATTHAEEIKLKLHPQSRQDQKQSETDKSQNEHKQPLKDQPQQDQKKSQQEQPKQEQPKQEQKQIQQNLETAYIEWKPVEGAVFYQVEVADENKQKLFEKTTDATKLDIDLPYGKYYYRVGIITKFQKVSMWSDWTVLMVVPALEPTIVSVSPSGMFTGISGKIILKGKNFYRKSAVSLQGGGTAPLVTGVRYIDPETLSVTVNTKSAMPGVYDIVVKNPGNLLNLTTVAKNKLTLTQKPPGYPLEYYLALEVGYTSPTLGVKDAFAGAMGFNFFCEFHSIGRSHEKLAFLLKAPGFYPGIVFSYSGFLSKMKNFGTSMMIETGLFFGYEFSFPVMKDMSLHVAPVLGYKQYYRWHTFNGMNFYGTRPMLFTGGSVTVDLPMKFFIGLSLEYDLIMELEPLNTLGVFVRCGYRL